MQNQANRSNLRKPVMLIKSALLYTLARVLPGIISVVTTALLTRFLKPTQYGVYSSVIVTMMLIANIGFDWLGPLFVRLHEARKEEPSLIATFVLMFMLVAASSALLMVFAWALSGFRLAVIPIYVIGIGLAWAFSWFELVSKFEIARFRPWRYLRMNVLRASLVLITATSVAWATHDPLRTAAASGIALLASSVFGDVWTNKLNPRKANRTLFYKLISFGLPVWISMALLGLVTNGTRALVGILDSTTSLGLYSAVFVLVQQSLLLVGNGIGSATFPFAVRVVEQGDQALVRRQMLDNARLLLTIAAPACLLVALTPHGFSRVLLAPAFRVTAFTLTPWMAAASFFTIIRSNFFDHAFLLGNRPRGLVTSMVLAAVCSLALSIILIPRIGSQGAAIALTAAGLVSCIYSAVAGRRIFPLPLPLDTVARVMVCCVVMTCAVLLIPSRTVFDFILQAFTGAFAYVVAAVAFNLYGLRTRATSFLSSSISH
jgi:O-antigen/teichoic acid export membrane protein